MRQCSDTVKKVSLELGGNAPFIVFDDADLDAALPAQLHQNTAMPGRPVFAPTAFWFRTVSMTPLPPNWLRLLANCALVTAPKMVLRRVR